MTAKQILKSVGLKPDEAIFSVDREGALVELLDFIEEWELPIKVGKISKNDWETIFASYANAIVNYHPDDNHQERIVFLNNEELFKKYGLADEHINVLDFF